MFRARKPSLACALARSVSHECQRHKPSLPSTQMSAVAASSMRRHVLLAALDWTMDKLSLLSGDFIGLLYVKRPPWFLQVARINRLTNSVIIH